MKYQCLSSTVSPRISRKVIRCGSKRSADAHGTQRSQQGRRSEESDLSNDSGLGLDHQLEVQLATRTATTYTPSKVWSDQEPDTKRRKPAFQFEQDEVNDDFCFPEVVRRHGRSPSPKENMPGRGRGTCGSAITLSTPLNQTSRDGKTQLVIVCQPEQQHRARYQTEGSRGAVKDRTGNGFPVVKLVGYSKPTTLQVFIGTDVGRVAPHMFYQACRVSGKNSTPCVERKVDGTVVIEVDLDPSKDMMATCDCVGILKERNVDVEHRFPDQTGSRNKKKSTRCRIVFRTCISNADGGTEVLQMCSQPIVCTQPPGVPEICKKSLSTCSVTGGTELFILGKNFLKDTRVVFQHTDVHPPWEESVVPDKEFLQQTHLVCVVPPYRCQDIVDPVTVKVVVTSSGKASDPHTLVYLPASNPLVPALTDTSLAAPFLPQAFVNGNRVFAKGQSAPAIQTKPHGSSACYFETVKKDLQTVSIWETSGSVTKAEQFDQEDSVMPPPPALIPLVRRPSALEGELKPELADDASQASQISAMGETEGESLSPTDLSMKAPLLRHLIYPPDDRHFLQEALLRPPPAREFPDAMGGFLRGQGVPPAQINESSQSCYDCGRTRSGSFSNSPPMSDHGYETFPRCRTSSLSHSIPHNSEFEQAPSFEARPAALGVPMVIDSECSVKDINAMAKQTVPEMQPVFYCQADGAASQTPTTTSSQLQALVCTDILTTTAQTRSLDAFVNSAAETHMPINTVFPVKDLIPVPFDTIPTVLKTLGEESCKTVAVPVTVKELEGHVHNMGDMVLPPGPAPPLTGMVPQEMVKMTDNDLISYINPSCFDQV